MACGCSKGRVSQTANAARASRVMYRPQALSGGLAPDHAKDGNRYRRVKYLVALKVLIEEGELAEAESYPTLAEAQKRIRDLGPTYGVKATRD